MPRPDSLNSNEIFVNSTQRVFTGREEPQTLFKQALAEVNERDHSILCFYGIGGIGKSRLIAHLKEQHLDKDDNYLYSSVDFDNTQYQNPHRALRRLVQNFKNQPSKIPFPAFELAYLIYWEKAYPDIEIKKSSLPFLEEGGIVADGIGLATENTGAIGSIALRVLEYAFKKSRELTFDENIKTNLNALSALDSEEKIEQYLHQFFAYDIQRYKEKHSSKKIVIFLDTYEALWKESGYKQSNQLSQDAWIRDGLVSKAEKVLFVICGREELLWIKDDTSWQDDLTQQKLEDLDDEDAMAFLQSCKITDIEIQNRIIADSEGVPYYLDLCVDTFEAIKHTGKQSTVEDFTEVGKNELFSRFMKYLNTNEAETLKVLSNARFYTLDLAEQLIEEFKTYYPLAALNQLNRFSFIHREEKFKDELNDKQKNNYRIHDLMQHSLKNAQSNEEKDSVHQFLFEVYDKQLQDLQVKNITEKNQQALPEAFYHKQKTGDIKELIQWYVPIYNTFENAAKYYYLQDSSEKLSKSIKHYLGESHIETGSQYHRLACLYLYQSKYDKAEHLFLRSLSITEQALGKNHSESASILNNLAALYQAQSKFDEAEPIFLRSLSITEKLLGNDHPLIASTLNNLAQLYRTQDEFDKAEPLLLRSLSITEKILGNDHSSLIGTALNNLAGLYKDQGMYSKAEALYLRVQSIDKKTLANEHPLVANTLNNLSGLYCYQGKFDKAVPLLLKSLMIKEKAFGQSHPSVATALHNLAGVYYQQNKYKEALPLLRRALSILKKVFPDGHPDINTFQASLEILQESINK